MLCQACRPTKIFAKQNFNTSTTIKKLYAHKNIALQFPIVQRGKRLDGESLCTWIWSAIEACDAPKTEANIKYISWRMHAVYLTMTSLSPRSQYIINTWTCANNFWVKQRIKVHAYKNCISCLNCLCIFNQTKHNNLLIIIKQTKINTSNIMTSGITVELSQIEVLPKIRCPGGRQTRENLLESRYDKHLV